MIAGDLLPPSLLEIPHSDFRGICASQRAISSSATEDRSSRNLAVMQAAVYAAVVPVY